MREPRRWLQAGYRGWPLRSGRRRPGIFCRPNEHRRPRDTGGTHPGRISCVGNVGTPMGSGHSDVAGKPTARKAQSPSEGRMTWEANAGGRKATGNRGKRPALRRSPRTTGRIRAADSDQLLAAIGAHADEHQAAQPLVFHTNVEMDPVSPEIHVVDMVLRRWRVVSGSSRLGRDL